MDYRVETSGRILLPEDREAQLVPALAQEVATRSGRLTAGTTVSSLEELAPFAGARAVRDGEWVLLATDRSGQPTWSEQAWAFYSGLAREVHAGDVRLRGVDGIQWSYRYTDVGMVQEETPALAGPWSTGQPAPLPADPPPGPGGTGAPTGQGPAEVSSDPGGVDPALAAWPPTPDPSPTWAPAGHQDDAFWRSDEPAPRSTGRTVAMALLLVIGVLLIVGVAVLAAGII